MGKKLRFKSVISLCGGFLVLWFVVCLFGLLFFVLFWGGGVIFFFFLAAGVKRESEEDKSFGDFVIEGKDSPYRTLNFTFEPYDFSRLVEVNRYNVLNSKDALFKTLNLALQRRKLKNIINTSNT